MPRSKALEKSPAGDDFRSEMPLKIAILLPRATELRKVRQASQLALELLAAEPTGSYSIEIAIGLCQEDERQWRQSEHWIRQRVPSAVVRHLDWTPVPVANARRMFTHLSDTLDLEGIEQVSVPRDWGWNFQDCDFWINFADPRQGAVLPLRPVVHICTDLAERYVPEAVASSIHDEYWARQTEAFRLWRQGLVVTSDPDTAKDLVSYAGVRRERIELIPDVLDTLPARPPAAKADRQANRLLWLLCGNALDDLGTALHALSIYRREGGALDIQIASERDHRNHPQLAGLPSDLQELFEELPAFTYRSLEELERTIARSSAIWSSAIAGGDGEHVHDAARSGLPLIAPDFPQNRRTIDRLKAQAVLYAIDDSLGAADALFRLQRLLSDKAPAKSKTAASDLETRHAEFGFLIDRLLEMRDER